MVKNASGKQGYRSFTVVGVGKQTDVKLNFMEESMFQRLLQVLPEKLSLNYAVLRKSEVFAL